MKYQNGKARLSVVGTALVVVSFVAGTSVQMVRAFVEPTSSPPGGNVAGPLSITDTEQTKGGGLIINDNDIASNGLDVANGDFLVRDGEASFSNGSYSDPDSGTSYDAKFGGSGNGIAVDGQSRFNDGVRIGNSTNNDAGNLRWTGSSFEGYDGSAWGPFAGGGTTLHSATSTLVSNHGGSDGAGGYTGTGTYNNFLGYQAGAANTSGWGNNFFGSFAGNTNTTGELNTFIGYHAGSTNTGGYNTYIGQHAGENTGAGSWNVFIGEAGKNSTSGNWNMFIGTGAGANNQAHSNIAVGDQAALFNVSGTNNISIGNWAGRANISGNANTAIGRGAMSKNVDGSRNTALGTLAGDNLTTGSSNIAIGYGIDLPFVTGSNQMSIGNMIFGTGIDGTGTIISTGAIGIGDNSPDTGTSILKLDVEGAVGATEYCDENGNNCTAASALGGASDFLSLSDTPASYTAGSLYFAGASAVSEDNANLFWDDTNDRLGIGTTSPQRDVDVYSASATLGLTATDPTGRSMAVFTNDTQNWTGSMEVGVMGTNFSSLQNRGVLSANHGLDGMTFRVSGGNVVDTGDYFSFEVHTSEKMRITGDGNVGIGVVSPTERLHIEGESANLLLKGASPTGDNAQLRLQNDQSTNFALWLANSGKFHSGNAVMYTPDLDIFVDGNTGGDGNLRFYLNSAGQFVDVPDIIFTNQGKIGVGDETPDTGVGTFGGELTLDVEGRIGATEYCDENGENCAAISTLGSARAIWDTDLDTGIQTEESADEDILRFDIAGTERWTMTGTRIEPQNTGNSVFIGYQAGLNDDLSTNDNNFIGYQAGRNNTTGTRNNFLGFWAGLNNTTGSHSNFLGVLAGGNNTTGSNNNFLGGWSGPFNTTGANNNFLGWYAGYSNTTGGHNNFLGYQAGRFNTTGSGNIAIGADAASGNTAITGESFSDTIALGYRAGYNVGSLTGGESVGNIFIGRTAGDNITTGSRNVTLGYNIDGVSATANDQLNIGNMIFGTGIDGTAATISSGAIGIGDNSPDTGTSVLKLDVEGAVGATEYCDENGNNCTAASALGAPTLTAGSVAFSDGTTLIEDNPNFFWDDTNNRIGIGTATPNTRLTLVDDLGSNSSQTIALFKGNAASVTGTGLAIIANDFASAANRNLDLVGISNSTEAATYKIRINPGGQTVQLSSNVLVTDGTILGGTASANATGKTLIVEGGTGGVGATGAAGGILTLLGGSATGTNNDGGNVLIDGGLLRGTGTDGDILLQTTQSGAVGIGDATPDTGTSTLKLDVEGAVGATEYCDENGNNCTAASALGGASDFLSLTDTPGAYTAGSLYFAGASAVSEDNANLFWDDTNNRLGIGTSSPATTLDVSTDVSGTVAASITNANTNGDGLLVTTVGTSSTRNVFEIVNGSGTMLEAKNNGQVEIYTPATSTLTPLIVGANGGGYILKLNNPNVFGRGILITSGSNRIQDNFLKLDNAIGEVLHIDTIGNMVGTADISGFKSISAAQTGSSKYAANLTSTHAFGRGLNITTSGTRNVDNALEITSGAGVILEVQNDGKVGIGDTTPDGALKLDVEGPIGATQYCDQDGNNCFAPTVIGTLGGGTTLNTTYDSLLSNNAGPSVDGVYTGTGLNNHFFGLASGRSMTTGADNNFFGRDTGFSNTTGASNSFLGYYAGRSNTSGGANNFFGYLTGGNSTTGSSNNFIGTRAGRYANGSENNYFGYQAGRGQSAAILNTGDYNNFIGYQAGYSNTTGGWNSFIGHQAGTNNTTGLGNNFLGYYAGLNNTEGNHNVAIGYQAGDNITTGSRNITLGYNIDGVSATGNDQLNIGNLIFGTGIDGTGTTISTGNIGIGTTTPVAPLDVDGGIALPTRGVAVDTNVTVDDNFILCDATTANVTVTLPSVGTVSGFEVTVKKTDASANTCTISGGATNIDGATTKVISAQYDSFTVVSDGTQWWIK